MSSLMYALACPADAMRDAVEGLRSRHNAGALVIFIVAAAILLAMGLALAGAVALFCMNKGGSVEWYTTNGWKVWEIKIACRMP